MQLRRAMATFKLTGGVSQFRDKMISGMLANGYTQDFAERTFKQIEGFGSYGFPESHAASFAKIAYASSWMKCHHPDIFCCALLNAQPMGFYAPAQLVRDAREHGVEIRPVCINALALGLHAGGPIRRGRDGSLRRPPRPAHGQGPRQGARRATRRCSRGRAPVPSIEDVWRRAGVPVAALEKLADADAFRASASTGGRPWAIRGLRRHAAAAVRRRRGMPGPEREPAVPLAPMTGGREVVEDYARVGLSLRGHPLAFLREELGRRGIDPLRRPRPASRTAQGRGAGLVLVRQKPGKGNVTFITIEDETGIANMIIWPSVFERQRRLVLTASMIACHGKVQKESGVIHVITDRLTDLSGLLRDVGERDDPVHSPPAAATKPATAAAPTRAARSWARPRDTTARSGLDRHPGGDADSGNSLLRLARIFRRIDVGHRKGPGHDLDHRIGRWPRHSGSSSPAPPRSRRAEAPSPCPRPACRPCRCRNCPIAR